MGCRCREIRAAIDRVPGGKFLTGLLPALPKGPTMKMLARVAGQSFNLANGAQYFADDDRVVEVETHDVAEMRRVGCVELVEAAVAAEPVAAAVPVAAAEPQPPAEADHEPEAEHGEL